MSTDYYPIDKFNALTVSLKERLQYQLPGEKGQLKMSPQPSAPRFNKKSWETARKGAVLILLYPGKDDVYFPLIRRPEYNGVHSGQVALPGGARDDNDQDLIETALREAEEEVGLDKQKVNVIGELSELYIPPSNFLVKPIVGIVDYQPKFKKDPFEVAAIIEAQLTPFYDASYAGKTIVHTAYGSIKNTPFYPVADQVVWGATAMILGEFSMVLSELKEGRK